MNSSRYALTIESNKMNDLIVLLKDGTCGYVYSSSVETGDIVTVHLHDENGMPIEKIGEVMEVLS